MSSEIKAIPPSPQTTLLLLLGASQWPNDPLEFRASEGFAHGAQKIEQYFLQLYGMPSTHICSYFDDPRSGTDITKGIYGWLRTIEGEVRDLIIYYIGHAKHTTLNRQLYLAIQDTRKFDPEGTSLRVDSLVKAIKTYPALRHYYIFDCCFAATAIANLQGASEKDLLENTLEDIKLEKRGVTALFSSGKAEASAILPDQKNTFFSEALLTVLQNTSATRGASLSFAEVYPEINRQLDVLYQQYRFHPDVQKPPIAHLYLGNLSNVPIFPRLKCTTSDSSPQPPRLAMKEIQQIIQLGEHAYGVTALALSPDNQTLVSGDKKGKVKVWDLATRTFSTPKYPFSDAEKISVVASFSFGIGSPVAGIAFHPGGRTFFVGWENGRICLAQLPGGIHLETIRTFNATGSTHDITALAVSPDGLVLVHAGHAAKYSSGYGRVPTQYAQSSLEYHVYSKTDQAVDKDNYAYIGKFHLYDCDGVTPSITFSPTGHFFAASSFLGTVGSKKFFAAKGSRGAIRLWDIPQGKERPPLTNEAGSWDFFTSIAFHPEEEFIAAINKEGQCMVWNVSTGTVQHTLDPLAGKITVLTFSPDGYYLVAAHSSGVIGFWDPFSGELLHSFRAHDQSIPALVYSLDGYHLVTGSLDKTIKVWGNTPH